MSAVEREGWTEQLPVGITEGYFEGLVDAGPHAGEQRWRACMTGLLDAFGILRCVRDHGEIVDFEFVCANDIAASTYQRGSGEMTGARVSDLVPGFQQSDRFSLYKQLVDSGTSITSSRYGYSDEVIDGIFDLHAWKMDDGFAVTWRDVTERERATDAIRAGEERFRASVAGLHDALSIFSAVRDDAGHLVDFRWDYANETASAMTGYASDDLAGRLLLEVLPQHDGSGMLAIYRLVVETGEPYVEPSLWYEDVWGDGTLRRRAFDVRATKLHDGFVVVTREVTQEREQEAAVARQQVELERSNREMRLLNEMGEFLQGCVTPAEICTIAARSSRHLLLGSSGSVAITGSARDFLESQATWGETSAGEAVFTPVDCWALRRGRVHISGISEPRCPHLLGSGATWGLCVPMIGQGEPIGVYSVVYLEGSDADPVHAESVSQLAVTVAGQVSMVIANLRLRDTLRSLSIRDPLTGLFNRRYMEETLARELSRAKRATSSVAMLHLDIDHFKQFNDVYGHEAGDVVLRAVADTMMGLFRDSDVACRYGGEEFTVILPDCTLAAAQARAEQLRAALTQLRIAYDRAELAAPTVSCGIAAFPEHGRTADALLRTADQALYAAKAAGRDRVVGAPC